MDIIKTQPARTVVILHGLLDLCKINKLTFQGYSIYANLNVIICKRIISNILAQQQANTLEENKSIHLESYIHDFAVLRTLEYSNIPVLFVCININVETLKLIQMAYSPDIYSYEKLEETEAIAKYPEYFILKSAPLEPLISVPSSPSSSPSSSSPSTSFLPLRLHDDGISCILEDQLYLSGSVGAEDLSQLLELGITHIINITDMIPNYHEKEMNNNGESLFTYMNIAIPDCGSIQLAAFLPDVIHFITNAINSNGRVLVHCFAGKSRSASIVIAFIMQSKRWGFQEAFKFVQSKRDVVDPNFGFCTQLMEYEKNIL